MRSRLPKSKYSKYLVIAHGEPLSAGKLRSLARGRFVICLDGAANDLPKFRPDLLLGDMDGITPQAMRRIQRWKVPVIAIADQNTTDLEKALLYCAMRQAKDVVVVAATGRRVDHTLTNLSLLRRFDRKGCLLELRTERERVRFMKNKTSKFKVRAGQRVSFFGAPETVITAKGVRYPVSGMLLRWGLRESISNECTSQSLTVKVKGEAILVLEEK